VSWIFSYSDGKLTDSLDFIGFSSFLPHGSLKDTLTSHKNLSIDPSIHPNVNLWGLVWGQSDISCHFVTFHAGQGVGK
jgi:hypothetical protein